MIVTRKEQQELILDIGKEICKRGYTPDDAACIIDFGPAFVARETDQTFRKLVKWYREWSGAKKWQPMKVTP